MPAPWETKAPWEDEAQEKAPWEEQDKFADIRNISPNIGKEGAVISKFFKPVTDLAKDTADYYLQNAKAVAKPVREAIEEKAPWAEQKMMESGNPMLMGIGKELDWLRTSPNARPVTAGINESLVGQGVKALTDKPLYDNFNVLGEDRKIEAPGEYTPQSLGGKVVKGVSEMAADTPLYAVGSALAAPVRAGVGAIENVPKLLKPAQWLAKHALGGGTMFGAVEAIKSPVSQLADKGEITLDKWAEDMSSGILTGAVAEPAFVLGGKALGLPFKTVWKAVHNKLIEKGYAISEKQAKAMEKAYEKAWKRAEEGRKQDTLLKKIKKLDRKVAKVEGEPLDNLDATELNLMNEQRAELLDKVRNLPRYKTYAKTGMDDNSILKAMIENRELKTTGGGRFDLTKKTDRNAYAQYLYKDAARKNGILINPETGQPRVKAESSKWQKLLLNSGELFDSIEAQTGIKMGDIPSKMAELSNESKNRTAQYINRLQKTTAIDGKKLKKILLGEIAPKTDTELLAAREARSLLNDVHKELVDQGMLKEAQFVKNYLPREGVPGSRRAASMATKGGKVNLGDRKMSFQYKRTAELERLGAEEDAHKIIGHYLAKVERGIMLKNSLPDIQRVSWQLRAMGLNGKARDFEKFAERALGLEPSGRATVFEAEVANASTKEIMAILEQAGLKDQDLSKSLYNHIMEMNYNALIGMNPKMLFYEQPMQGRIYGDIEMGHGWNKVGENMRASIARFLDLPLAEYKWLGRGKKNPIPKDIAMALKRNYNKLLGPELEPLEQFGFANQGKLPSTTEKLFKFLNIGSKKGMERFQKLEHLNRASTFTSAFNKMDTLLKKGDMKEVAKAMETFNTSQKRQVMELLEKGDLLGAADRFGLTMANRVHFLYSAFDKPLYLQGGLGNLLPFTTWGRNQFARMYTDYSHGDAKQMAKRFIIPILYAKGLEYGTGLKPKGQSGSQLLMSNTGAATAEMGPAPTVSAITKNVVTGNYNKIPGALASTTPITKPIMMGKDLLKEKPSFGGFNYNKYNLINALIAAGVYGADKLKSEEKAPWEEKEKAPWEE